MSVIDAIIGTTADRRQLGKLMKKLAPATW
jgi:hypothetical protein